MMISLSSKLASLEYLSGEQPPYTSSLLRTVPIFDMAKA
jgi:hypothetical protein